MNGDTRAVSAAVTQALTIAISTILIMGLLIGGSSFVNAKQEHTVRQGLQDIGSGVASDLVRLDQFNASGVPENVTFTSNYPDRVGGENYEIRLVPGPDVTTIYINSTSSNLGTQVRFANETGICASQVPGGQLSVVYDTDRDCLEVREA